MLSAREAKQKLTEGNRKYLEAEICPGDISPEIRRKTAEEGQRPYAIIITCSDSRVIPESIFSAGIGELFVIRVAGNVLDKHQLGSIEYAAEHLGTKLIVMLGHTGCGAIAAAIEGHTGGLIDYVLKDIAEAIGEEKNDLEACRLNVIHGTELIRKEMSAYSDTDDGDHIDGCDHIDDCDHLCVIGAIYHIEDGSVEFLPENR